MPGALLGSLQPGPSNFFHPDRNPILPGAGENHHASPRTQTASQGTSWGPKGTCHLLPTFLSWLQIWSGQTHGTCQFDGCGSCVRTLLLVKSGINNLMGNQPQQALSGLKHRGRTLREVFKDPLLNLLFLETVWEY